MSWTFVIVDKKKKKAICPLNEETGKPYVNNSYDPVAFINQYRDGVTIEISEPGHILKNDLVEARRLLEITKNKLRAPGRYDTFADEIERFLEK